MTRPYRSFKDHVLLAIRLTPNGGRDSLESIEVTADGNPHLRARVTAVPEKGRANKALIALLSKSLKCPKSAITLASGDTARQKILRIEGDPEDLAKRIDTLISP